MVQPAQGDELARKNREIIAKKMAPEQVAEAQRLAREWMEKHEKRKDDQNRIWITILRDAPG